MQHEELPNLTPVQQKVLENMAMAATYQDYALGLDLKNQSKRLNANSFLVRAMKLRLQVYAALRGKDYPANVSDLTAVSRLIGEDKAYFRTKNAATDFWHLHSEAHRLLGQYRESELPEGYTALILNLNRVLRDGNERLIEAAGMSEIYGERGNNPIAAQVERPRAAA